MELLHNLPALVVQLKALRDDMERKSKLYDPLLRSLESTVPMSFDSSQNGTRGSIYAPFSSSMLDPRASQMTLEDLSSLNTALDDTHYANTMVSRQSSIMRRQKQQGYRRSTRLPQTRSAYSMNNMSMGRMGPEKFTVMWVSGECGISLRNFSRNDNKVGAQIAVLQHVDGVTTGISNCRLGDQLVTINDERVDALTFSEILEKLKLAQCPIALGFRTNANVQTSPRAASSPSNNFRNSTGMSRSGAFFSTGGSMKSKEIMKKSTVDRHSMSEDGYTNANKLFGHHESSDMVHETIGHHGYVDLTSKLRSSSGAATMNLDRSTITSVQSSSSTLSDELEIWCREQEEMHSVIIVLLTETIMRCEKLQQENLDQLQNLMQLSASSPQLSDSSSTVSYYAGADRVSNVENQLDVLGVNSVVLPVPGHRPSKLP
ncbi:unnamed protein product [Peronospora destructor]|uniref:PDZ domain-containing protein n=1 Tax=Peronospora destructor TaxID=86335 RepID=A0AAV0TUJ4_9STRA|nr:unnamed protein product [Peronospora destructor]